MLSFLRGLSSSDLKESHVLLETSEELGLNSWNVTAENNSEVSSQSLCHGETVGRNIPLFSILIKLSYVHQLRAKCDMFSSRTACAFPSLTNENKTYKENSMQGVMTKQMQNISSC